MSIPTDGTYPGIDIYQVVQFDTLPAGVQSAVDALAPLLQGTGLSIPTQLLQTVATNADVSFNGSTLAFTADGGAPTTLDDTGLLFGPDRVFSSGPTGFGFFSGGSEYVLSNGVVPDMITADAGLSTLAGYYQNAGNPDAAQTVLAAQAAVDAAGLGGLAILTTAGIFDGQPYQPPCFARGTLIRTVDGERAVETLDAGTRVVLAGGGDAEIVWVGHRRLRLDGAVERPELQRPIRVGAGTLGGGLPRRDLVVSPDHALFLDGVLVPAGLLVDGTRIRQEVVETIEYFHVELAAHDVILAEGAPAESYLDTGNRQTFANAPLVALRPDLSAGSARIGTACAEMVLGGERLEAIRARLAAVPAEAMRQAS